MAGKESLFYLGQVGKSRKDFKLYKRDHWRGSELSTKVDLYWSFVGRTQNRSCPDERPGRKGRFANVMSHNKAK